jgi:GH18 family chitinase
MYMVWLIERAMLAGVAALASTALALPQANAPKVVVGYVQNWGDMAAFSTSFDFASVTHINIAFENPLDDDGNMSFHASNDALIAKAHQNHVKVLLSIGGGGASSNKEMIKRYFGLQSDPNRAKFVAKLASYLTAHNFDGLDVDLEGPSIGTDYGAFVADLSKALGPRQKLLTAAVSQGYGGDQIPDSVFAQFDFVNVMAYDGTGPWDPSHPGQHSSMDYMKENVQYWLGRGVPKSKMVVGVPFYGYGFGKAFRNDGYTYSEILSTYPGADQADQVGDTIWYNGVPTMKLKAKYVLDQSLAGMMIWSLDQDTKGSTSLLAAMNSVLRP